MEDGADAASRGVADGVDVGAGGGFFDHVEEGTYEGGAVALYIGIDAVVASRKEDGGAVAADVAGDEDVVAGLGEGAAGLDAFHHFADAGGGDEEVVDLAAARDFGVAGDEVDAGFGGGFGHGGGDGVEVGKGEAFFNLEGAGEVAGAGAHACKVVDGAADGEFADVAAGEAPGAEDEAVGGHGDAGAFDGEDGGVVGGEVGAFEVFGEEVMDEGGGFAAASAVGEGDGVGHETFLSMDAICL